MENNEPDSILEREGSIRLTKNDKSRVKMISHPLRWNRTLNQPRYEAHIHPLRVVHSQLLYPQNNGNYFCDVGKHSSKKATYVFNCSRCDFDICLGCVSLPCFDCTSNSCIHTQIKIKMV